MFLTTIFQSNCVINLFYIGLDLAVVNLPTAAHEKSVISRSDVEGRGGGGGKGGLDEGAGVITFPETPCKHQPYKFKDCKFNKCLLAKRDQRGYEQQKVCGERGLVKLSSLSVKTKGRTFAYLKKRELILLRYFN